MEPTKENRIDNRQLKRLLLGVIVIFAGLILLGYNAGIISYQIKHVIFSWQMILITIGVVSLLVSENRLPGLILLTVGGFFLLPRIFDFPFSFSGIFWPVILILVGLFILFRRIPPRTHHHRSRVTENLQEGYINEDCIFSGSKQKIMHQTFHGGSINCVFGGVDLDLTQATLAEGTSELEINVVFGGVNIVVPADWKVILKATAILGGFSDKRNLIREPSDPSKVLIIKGSTIFGGGEIKSY